jgi:hypothetical protein
VGTADKKGNDWMKKEKPGGPLPVLDTRIWVENRLRDKAIHVIITPNEDYQLAELLMAFASLGSSALDFVKTASDLVLLLRTLSLAKNAKAVIDKLKGVIPECSITIPPRQVREVYDALRNDPLKWTKASGIVELFGGKTVTLIITDEDFKNTVKFNTELNKSYHADETGVWPPMHYWNGGHIASGLLSSVSPSLIRMGENDMLVAYRDHKGDRIYIGEFIEGRWRKKGRGYVQGDTKEAVGVTMMRGNMCLVGRDYKGDQMFSLWQSDRQVPFDPPVTWMGVDIQGKPSATTANDTTYIVAKHYPGNAVMWAIRQADGHTAYGNTMLNTVHPPSIHEYKGMLYLFFTRMDTWQICVAVSDDGQHWREVRNDLPRTSAGVALTVYKDRLYVFFRDGVGNGVFYMWTEDGSKFNYPANLYFGLDVASEPTASPMPGGNNGIMVAGLLPAEWRIADPTSFPDSEAIVWTILMPWEPPKALAQGKTVKRRPAAAAKKAAKKTASKTAAAKKPVAKKAVKPKGKATAARKALSAKPAKKAGSRKSATAGAKRKK